MHRRADGEDNVADAALPMRDRRQHRQGGAKHPARGAGEEG